MESIQEDRWYASWFNTPYYHSLYADRNHAEARDFMRNLVQYLKLSQDCTILDLACGRGRHSLFLNALGYDVVGVDLSVNSIAYAKSKLQQAATMTPEEREAEGLSNINKSRLKFDVHNMTAAYPNKFNAVFNLFTSFGYFDDPADNLKTIVAIKEELKENGKAVIDFMNAHKVIKNLVPFNEVSRDGITYKQYRRAVNGHIFKDIHFIDNHRKFHFTEKVEALTLKDFQGYFEIAGLKLIDCFGNYKLEPYDELNSDRLIMVFESVN